MYSKTTTIQNKTGLHARPASDFVGASSKFTSRITLTNESTGDEANAKSIVMILALGLEAGTPIKITAKGEDEGDAVDALVALVDSGFGE